MFSAPSRSASADHTSIASSHASEELTSVASSLASPTAPAQSSASSPYAALLSDVEDGEGIQYGHPVTVTFLKYRFENEILEDMSNCVSGIVSQWKALLLGPELTVLRTMGGNHYSAQDWGTAVEKVPEDGTGEHNDRATTQRDGERGQQ